MKKTLGFLGNEIFLGTMIALLSVFTAVASYQGAMADSEQNKFEILGMQYLNDGNAEYLSKNGADLTCTPVSRLTTAEYQIVCPYLLDGL